MTNRLPVGIVHGQKGNAMGQIVLFTGVEFTAKSKLDSYRYRMIGVEPTKDHTYNIRLLNLDTDRIIFVESAWFGEREITVIQNVK